MLTLALILMLGTSPLAAKQHADQPVIPQDVQALWWACYAARHDLLPPITIMEMVGAIIHDKQQRRDFIGLCWGA